MMNRFFRHIVVITLLMIAGGFATAQQTTGQFVIKTTVSNQVHYLSHADNALGDATVFSPNVLWTSDNTHTQAGANKNYYYYDGVNYRFLGAPSFEAGAPLSLSASLPLANQLNTPESQYYFYKWDGGLGRGVQYFGSCANSKDACKACGHVWGDDQCWDVFWVAYVDGGWKLSGKYYDLDSVPSGGSKYYSVTITEHAEETTVTAGGLSSLEDFEIEYQGEQLVTPTIADYQYTVRPAYTSYFFDNGTHNYWGDADHGESIPDAVSHGPISGDGASYLTISDASSATPTIRYSTTNNSGHKTATLTLTVTYSDGSTQTTSATITVKTPCQNPTVSDQVVVTYIGATVTWTHTAESYLVSWKKNEDATWTSHEVGDVSTYTITGLEYGNQVYEFKVMATSCSTVDPVGPYPTFTTLPEPGLIVGGAIFGGGRMADVGGSTEVVVVNCDMINAIYGGNDIAGTVEDADGSTIILGVNSGDATYSDYGVTNGAFDVGSVYGGGNGYYAYNGSSFVAATGDYKSQSVAVGGHVNAMTQLHSLGDVVWTNDGTTAKPLTFPSIVKTAIRVSNDFVTVDSIFGGAKNAFLTLNINSDNGSSIIIDGGTVFAVFGGNNFGGGQGFGKHYIEVNGTKTNLTPSIVNTDNSGYGRDFGIRYLYGGGNKVAGSTTDIHIRGGQVDELFAGGNAADIYIANVTVECSLGADAGDHIAFGNTFTNAINHSNYSTGTIGTNTVKSDYAWDGLSGIYNVRTLYGGNNQAEMSRVPTITLTSGSVGTVYGGGNAGDMMGADVSNEIISGMHYGTKVVLNSDKILVDYVYGGCRMSNVFNSTWVELSKGHVGTVYGGCNISGDVGNTRIYHPYPSGGTYPTTLEEQRVRGATYVRAGAGSGDNSNLVIYKDLFAGSNGYYHCSSDGIHYVADTKFGYPADLYAGMTIPTHNETNVMVREGVTVKGNVYAGGNLAPVGFDDNNGFNRGYPELVGMATVLMSGGVVEKNVYGGGKMASIFGGNEVKVSGGTITKALYGGNDIAGQVAEKTNRILPSGYGYTLASDDYTSLTDMGVRTFVGVSGNAHIGTVYGGGNGDYVYDNGMIPFCGTEPSYPIQPHTFVDIHINGGASGGKINTVYGGGNGVTIRGGATVFVNIANHDPNENFDNIDTIFGGNNKGDLVVVPDIRLVHGQVGYVYGGCNRGAMRADASLTEKPKTIGGYENVGSYVRLLNEYVVVTDNSAEPPTTHTESVTAMVSKAVFGGCRMNGVTNNSLVLVEGGNYLNTPIYGGSDISGNVGGCSRVAVTGGTTGNIYGGGNGDYDYDHTQYKVYKAGMEHNDANLVASGDADITAPICANSGVDVLGGTVGASGDGNSRDIFGGGLGHETSTEGDVLVNVAAGVSAGGDACVPTIYGDVYGGSALGSVNTLNNNNTTTVNILDGTLHGNVYGGGLGQKNGVNGATSDIAATVNGVVTVNIGEKISTPGANEGDPPTITYSGNAVFDNSSIYGCNNLYGSPKDDVYVNIYKTKHGADVAHNLYPLNIAQSNDDGETGLADDTSPTVADLQENAKTQTFAIANVFGGGNLAAYIPEAVGEGEEPHSTTVHVYDCKSNTVEDVFGGGNAADVGAGTVNGAITARANTFVIIDGGRFRRVIGGGNGEDTGKPAANIFGTANTTIYAGLIDEVYGGANVQGSVDAINLDMAHSTTCDHQVYDKVFGCANEAPYNRSVHTTLECNVGEIGQLYGGSNMASIGDPGNPNTGVDVRLDLYGGNLETVFAGSKGVSGNPGTPAHIYGNVTLNLYGGKVVNAFGGSDANGNITGLITVNVLDYEGTCGLDVTNIYGASNQTPYAPTFTPASGTDKVSPVVNVMHIKQDAGVRGNIFGGGNQALVTASPQVNIGYHSNMASQIPEGYPIAEANRRAFVTGNVFGGGNMAGVTGNPTINMRGGTVLGGLYGGCNSNGTVTGKTTVSFTGGTMGKAAVGVQGQEGYVAQRNANIYGGGLGENTKVKGDVAVTIDAVAGHIYGDVYGGSAKGLVNCNDAGNARHDGTTTTVALSAGTIHGNLYGGGHGLESHAADVWGPVTVDVSGGNVTGVYGGNNLKGTPKDRIQVNITGGTAYTVVGGGNVADYTAPSGSLDYPEVNVSGGTVTNRVIGGGNEANVTGNPHVNISGGTIGTAGASRGIYGGCNTSGTVTGNVFVTLTGGTVGASGVTNGANIHGGGYGSGTSVTGNVTVTFGDIGVSQREYPRLYGALYGGSALGNVNTNNENNTTVNVYNGTIVGQVFGGGLGNSSYAALVNGVVNVNIGKMIQDGDVQPTFVGKATLSKCDVYGCNNENGTPKDNVFVNVYCTNRTAEELVEAMTDEYAIQNVFGGGKRAHYNPDGDQKTRLYVYGCDNTAEFLYAGGDAADAKGVQIIVEGGRFYEAYAGGNGLSKPANIGSGGTAFNFHGGTFGYTYEGSNKQGVNTGGVKGIPPVMKWNNNQDSSNCGTTLIQNHYFGANKAEIYVEVLENTIECNDKVSYRKVYAGSRYAIIYGDVKLTVRGGTIQTLYGGSQGYSGFSADIRRYPTQAEIAADVTIPPKYSNELRDYMQTHPELEGKGGNVTLVVTGGTIGKIVGGCDERGNVEGKISVIIADEGNETCPLHVGDVYGASSHAYYEPVNSVANTPQVNLLKCSLGLKYDFNGNGSGSNDVNYDAGEEFDGNVFGGGEESNIVSNPKVIIGDGPNAVVTVKGDVYGGGNLGNVDGSPQVVVVPSPSHTLNIGSPEHGTISIPHISTSPAQIGEGVEIPVTAIPANGYAFEGWTITETDPNQDETKHASMNYTNRATTTFTMGTSNVSINATFVQAHTITIINPPNGSIKVTDNHGQDVNNNDLIGEGTVLTIEAIPDSALSSGGFVFSEWNATGVTPANVSSTTITMPSSNVTLDATFTPAISHLLTITGTNGTYIVNGKNYNGNVSVAEGDQVTIKVTPALGYAFSGWSSVSGVTITNTSSPVITFTMGNSDVNLTASYSTAPELNIVAAVENTGSFKVNGEIYSSVISIPPGASTNVQAIPAIGFAFDSWSVVGTEASVSSGTSATTTFTMGTEDATLTANFVALHGLVITQGENGTFTVTDRESQSLTGTTFVGEGATLYLDATPADGYRFKEWKVTGAGSSVADATDATTTFTMGSVDATVTAIYEKE